MSLNRPGFRGSCERDCRHVQPATALSPKKNMKYTSYGFTTWDYEPWMRALPLKLLLRRFATTTNQKEFIDSVKSMIQSLQSDTPMAVMSAEQVQYCNEAINKISRERYNERGDLAEQLLERLVMELDTQNPHITRQHVSFLYSTVLRIWSRSSGENCASVKDQARSEPDILPYSILRSQQLLERMESRHRQAPHVHPPPNTYAFDAILHACAAASSNHAMVVQYAVSLVEYMEAEAQRTPNTTIAPTIDTYNILLLVFANHTRSIDGAASQAEDWLMRMTKLFADGLSKMGPNTLSFNRVLFAWRSSPDTNGATRAMEILQLMMQLHQQGYDIHPNPSSFAAVIGAYAERRQPLQAEEVFKEAVDWSHQKGCFIRDPDDHSMLDLTECLEQAILAWELSELVSAPDRIEALIQDAYVLDKHQKELSMRIRPTMQCHMSFMRSCLHQRGNVEAAERNLKQIVDSYRQSNKELVPTTGLFNTLLRVWLSTDRPDAGENVIRILQLMLQLSSKEGAPCEPNYVTLQNCIEVWCKRGGDPKAYRQVLDLLELAKQLQVVSFYCFQNAILFLCEDDNLVLDAAKVLENMRAYAEDGLIHIETCQVHVTVVEKLAKLGTAESAELALLILQDTRRLDSGALYKLKYVYGFVLEAFSKLENERASEVAYNLFKEMKTREASDPNLLLFTTKSCALILDSLARPLTPASALRRSEFLRHMVHLSCNGRRQLKPTMKECEACIISLCSTLDKDCVEEAVNFYVFLIRNYLLGILSFYPSKDSSALIGKAAEINNMEAWTSRVESATRSLRRELHERKNPVK